MRESTYLDEFFGEHADCSIPSRRYAFAGLLADWRDRMSDTIGAVRRGVALLLSPVLFLQACTAATAPRSFPPEHRFDREIVDGTIELRVDTGTAQPPVDAEEASQLQEADVIPLRLVIRNLGSGEAIVDSAGMTLKLNDGRVLQAISAFRLTYRARLIRRQHLGNAGPAMAPVVPPATDKEALKGLERSATDQDVPMWLKGTAFIVGPLIFAAALYTMPIWGPPVLISDYVKKKSEEKEQRKTKGELLRNSTLERLEEVHLKQGEAAGGLLYFAVEGERPDTLATARLIVPVRHADTGEAHSVRLPLGVENE